MEIIEYQAARPDGTVLLSALVPDGSSFYWPREEPGFQIMGQIVTRWRVCPDGKWQVTAFYPDGFASEPVPVTSEPLL